MYCPIVEDLTSDVLEMDGLTHMSLEEQISSLIETSMETVMIGLTEGCLHFHL
jgi:hypothetical protein